MERKVVAGRNRVHDLRAQVVELVARVDHMGNCEQRLALAFLLLLMSDVLKENGKPVFIRINADVVPCFKITVAVARFKRLKRLRCHRRTVAVAQLCSLCIGKNLKHMFPQHLVSGEACSLFGGPIPIGKLEIRIESKKSSADTF